LYSQRLGSVRTFSRLGDAIDGTEGSVVVAVASVVGGDSAVREDCCRNVVGADLVLVLKADAEESTARRAKVDNLAILLYLKSWNVMLLMLMLILINCRCRLWMEYNTSGSILLYSDCSVLIFVWKEWVRI
jgi:hypothetical protein